MVLDPFAILIFSGLILWGLVIWAIASKGL